LLRLYARGIELDDETAAELADRSDGMTGAFIKELMRQAVVRAAVQERSPTADDVRAALDELLAERAALTRRLLGQPSDGNGPAPGGQPIPAMMRAIATAGLPIPPGIDFGP
jgi:cell division protease FtsH